MTRLYLIGGIAAALIAAGVAVYFQGARSARDDQAKADATEYSEIIKEMEDAGIDVSDRDAVLRELCRLASFADLPECGDL